MLNLGTVFTQTSDYRHAAAQYQQCLALSRKLNATQGIAFSLNNLAEVYMHLGRR
jgi:tetratricopeptide repeat protein